MFDHIEGRLTSLEATRLVLRVGFADGCIAYSLQTPLGTAQRLGAQDDRVRVYTLTITQDEQSKLLGFASEAERDLCRLLLKVSGVGPKLALTLLSADRPQRILSALSEEDHAFLSSIKGIGPKTAQRLCLEIKERARRWLAELGVGKVERAAMNRMEVEDAMTALTSLGFTASEAQTRVRKVLKTKPDADTEALVKAALLG